MASALWIGASCIFALIREVPGATAGGKNALDEALERLNLLRTDPAFRRFVWIRALLVSTGLTAPFYVTLARENSGSGNLLALFILASGLAAALSSGFWGRFSDRYGRKPALLIGLLGFSLGFGLFALGSTFWQWLGARLLGGVLAAAALPTIMSYTADITPPDRRNRKAKRRSPSHTTPELEMASIWEMPWTRRKKASGECG